MKKQQAKEAVEVYKGTPKRLDAMKKFFETAEVGYRIHTHTLNHSYTHSSTVMFVDCCGRNCIVNS